CCVDSVVLLALVACSSSGASHERAGDLAWHDGRWADAVAAYRAAGTTPRVAAKEADAAMQGGMLTTSARAWVALASLDSDRAGEAAAGLARVADQAQQRGDSAGLAEAVAGLRQVAPTWPVGRIVRVVSGLAALPARQVQVLVPAALAANPDPEGVAPLLLHLGNADRAVGDCGRAVPVFQDILRRSAGASVRDSAAVHLGWCELGLGLTALAASHPRDAENWFDRVIARDSASAMARRALIGMGDARAGEGDSLAARLAWQAVAVAAVVPDSLTQLAIARLQRIVPSVRGGAMGPGQP
ncbi:MAG: tetratricopeptide repeat protein, partial [Gemmatimonadales bacterium]